MASGTVTVGAQSAQVAPANDRRGTMLIQNMSANNVWVSFGSEAVAGAGLLLPPAPSAPIVIDSSIFWEDTRLAIFAIASGANSKVYYILQDGA